MGRPLDHSQLNPLQAMHGAGDRLQGDATQQSSATTLSSYSYTRGVGRIGIGLPASQRSRFTHFTRLSAQQIATNRVLLFGNREQPRLLNSKWSTADIRAYMEYITRVVRSEAYDTSVIEASMDPLQDDGGGYRQPYPQSLDRGLGCGHHPGRVG